MSIWFVPRDAAARSMGADAVAMALELRGETVIRNGSRSWTQRAIVIGVVRRLTIEKNNLSQFIPKCLQCEDRCTCIGRLYLVT